MAPPPTPSIPIPSRPIPYSPAPDDDYEPLGTSLPTQGHTSLHDHSSRSCRKSACSTQDDLATIVRPQRPSVELVSRSAKKWLSGHRKSSPGAAHRRQSNTNSDEPVMRFEPLDFSEVALATDEIRTAFQRGSARAERPPREGVCGTYFIRSGNGDVLCVFKPVDEEAADIEMSPPPLSSPRPISFHHCADAYDFSLGPAHGDAPSVQSYSPLSAVHGPLMSRNGSVSSESEYDSRATYRASGFQAGEGAYKEVAAYLLDHDRFARVPQTALATCQFTTDLPEKNRKTRHIRAHSILMTGDDVFSGEVIERSTVETTNESHMKTKMGALQVFVKNEGDADDFGPGVFDKEQVHRIAILDIRTLNHDRHGGNILVTKSSSPCRRYNLVPIDHGYILPDGSNEGMHSIPWPVWMDWPMIRKPVSDRVKTYIEHLDAESEARILEKELDGVLRPGSLHCLKIATMFLQRGIAAGLTLYEIGLLIYTRREDPATASELGKIIKEAHDADKARHDNFTEHSLLHHTPIPLSLDDHHHRRHQSMSALHIPEAFCDDYVVKYAARRIQEVVRLAASKKNAKQSNGRMHRSRSIPDFGIGIRPLHLVTSPDESIIPTPTSGSSPVAPSRMSSSEMLETQVFGRSHSARQAPIRIPINDGNISRIAISKLRASPVSDSERFGEAIALRSAEDHFDENVSSNGEETKALSGSLSSMTKNSSRKSSPVAPQEFAAWDSKSL